MRERRITESKVAITLNPHEGTAVNEGFNLLGIDKIIGENDVVVITANWVKENSPETADVVGNYTLESILQYFKGLNPKRLIVAAGSGGGNTAEIMENVGYGKVIRETEAEFVDLNTGPFTQIKLNHEKPNSTDVNQIFNEMTFHVSFTQLKIHEEATMSASIKNMAMSWPPTQQHGTPKKETGIHENLHGFIAAMAEVIPIDLSIISGSPAMIGTGPHNGLSVPSQLVICGSDPAAADTTAARLLGFKPQAIAYLYRLVNTGYGRGENIEFLGLSLVEAENIFCEKAYGAKGFIVDKN